MNLNDLITDYNKAIEDDKVLEGQYQLLQNQLTKSLAELGMTYEEALEKEKELKEKLTTSIPKIEAYIQAVEEKKAIAQEYLV